MRKLIYYLAAILALTVCLGVAACSSSDSQSSKSRVLPLATPRNFELVGRTVEWDDVSGAVGYSVWFKGEETDTEDSRFVLPKGLLGGSYQIKVKAVGDNETYTDSKQKSFSFKLDDLATHYFDEDGWEYVMTEDERGYEISRGKVDLNGKLTIPAYFKGVPVVKIADEAFYTNPKVMVDGLLVSQPGKAPDPISGFNCNKKTTGITIPNTVTQIGESAFSGILNLQEITIPDSVTEIGNRAFYGCVKLKRVTLPKNLKKIPIGCFKNCSLSEISFSDGLEEICREAFTYNWTPRPGENVVYKPVNTFKKIDLPSSVKRIERGAFSSCTQLTDVKLPNKLDWMDYDVFDNTPWWDAQPNGFVTLGSILYSYKGEVPVGTKLTLPAQIKYLASRCFSNQKNLEEIVLPDGVKVIGESIFSGCSSLKKVKLPTDLTEIPKSMFSGCGNLAEIEIPSGVTEIGEGVFRNCSALQKIVLPNALKSIKSDAFAYCSSLQEIELPSSVTELASGTFSHCSALQKVVLSNGLKTIESSVFIFCSSLQEIVLPASLEKLGVGVFDKCDNLSKIYCEKTQEDWEALSLKLSDQQLLSLYYYSEEQPQQSGNYWRYVNGTPTVWEP